MNFFSVKYKYNELHVVNMLLKKIALYNYKLKL